MVSGCRDDQTSADAYIARESQGAMTWALLSTLAATRYDVTCFTLLRKMRKALTSKRMSQVPQLSASRPLQHTSVFSRGPTPPRTRGIAALAGTWQEDASDLAVSWTPHATESATTSATESATTSATESATASATESATASATESATTSS
jgi:hypothetical protein